MDPNATLARTLQGEGFGREAPADEAKPKGPDMEIVTGPHAVSKSVCWCDIGDHRLPANGQWWLVFVPSNAPPADFGAACSEHKPEEGKR